jgi:hypothetical protein
MARYAPLLRVARPVTRCFDVVSLFVEDWSFESMGVHMVRTTRASAMRSREDHMARVKSEKVSEGKKETLSMPLKGSKMHGQCGGGEQGDVCVSTRARRTQMKECNNVNGEQEGLVSERFSINDGMNS